MSVRNDTVNLTINVQGDAAQNQLNELRKRAADLSYEMKNNLKKGTQEYIDKAKELKQVNADMAALKKTIGITALSQKELTAELNKLKALKGSMTPFTREFKEVDAQIKAVEHRLYNVRNGVTGLGAVWSRLGDQVKQFGAIAAGYLGFQFITSQFRNIITGAGKLSDQLADLRRVAGLTAEETDALSAALGRIDTRTSTSGLREIAIIAGKLGVAKEDILGFTKAVDMLVVSLGDELGDADQITTQLGKILNVFDGKVTGENITKLGNAFVELANTGAATGAFIADFDQRLSGIAKSAGIGLGALSGLGAGLEEMGGRVESSATAIQKLIININSDIPKAAQIAGRSIEDFKKLLAIDPTEALLQYAEGLVKSKESFGEVVASMKDAGEEGARVIETISKLGSGADQLRGRIKLGTESIKENNAILEAFELKNETLGASIDKLGKEFYRLVMESGITDFLKGLVQGAISLTQWLKNLPNFIKENRITLALLVAGWIAMNAQLLIANARWLALKTTMLITMAAEKAYLAVQLLAKTGTLAFAAAQALLAGNISRAAAAWRLLGAAFKTSPIGAILTAVIGLGIALDRIFSKTSRLAKMQEEWHAKAAQNYGDQVNRIETLMKALNNENIGYEQKKKLYKELIDLNPEFAETLRLDAEGHLSGASAVDKYIEALKRKGNIEALQELSNERFKKIQESQSVLDMLPDNYTNANKRTKAAIALANAKKEKDYFDAQLQKMYQSAPATVEFLRPADTVTPGTQGPDKSIAARRKFLEAQIKSLKEAYEKLNAADLTGQKKNLDQQKKYQDELDRLDNRESKRNGNKENNERARLLKEAQKFFADIQKLKAQALIASKSDDEKELIALEEKYDEMHARALDFFKKNIISRKTFNEQEKQIVQAFQLELKNLQAKQFGERSAEEYVRSLKDTQDYFDTRRNMAGLDYAAGITDKQEYDAQIKDLDLKEKAQLVQVAKDYSATVDKANADSAKYQQDIDKAVTDNAIQQSEIRKQNARTEALSKAQLAVISAPEGSNERIAAQKELLKLQFQQDTEFLDKKSETYKLAEAQLNDALEQIDEDARRRRLDAWEQFAQELLSITGNFLTLLNNLDQRDLDADRVKNEAKKNNYKRQLDSKLINQKAYDKKVAEADAELEKKKKEADLKAFKRQQALAIVGALINGAMGVTSTLAARPGLADIFTLGAARAIQVALVVASTAAQVAAIASQKPPQAARGNWFRNGKKHRDGGIHVEIEQDEAVMKAATMTDGKKYTVTGTPAQITSKLNSIHGGVSWAAGADITPAFRNRPAQMNPSLPRIMEQGGIIRPIESLPQKGNDNDDLFRTLIAKQDELITEVKNQKERLHAVVSIKEYRDEEKKYDNARKSAGMKQ